MENENHRIKLTHRFGAKLAAVMLLLVFTLSAAASAVEMFYADSAGYYDGGVVTYEDSPLAENTVSNVAYSLMNTYDSCVRSGGYSKQEIISQLNDVYDGPNMEYTLSVRLNNNRWTELVRSGSVDSAGYTGSIMYGSDTVYKLQYTVSDRISEGDEFYPSYRLFTLSYELRYIALVILALSLVACALCVVFLLRAAGHSGQTDEVFQSWYDKIPFDVCIVASFALCAFMIAITNELSSLNAVATVAFVCVAAVCFLLICLALLMSFAVRVKLGVLWKNTLVWKTLRLSWKLLKRFVAWLLRISHALPIIWRTALVSAAALMFEFILSLAAMRGSGGLAVLLWLAYNFAIFLALCYGGLQMKKLKETGEKLAAGDMGYKLDTSKMYWEFRRHGDNLNSIGNGMSAAVDSRLKSERLKTELITNVSHDIKTPLTSIVNYVDLLQKPHTEQQQTEYLDVLSRQSRRLKKLTEDLVEASKASTGNMSADIRPTNSTEVINQAIGEYSEKLEAGKLETVLTLPEPPVSLMADGRLLWRIIDNLLSNVCKYAQSGTRVYIDVSENGKTGVITVKNISRAPLNISGDELMERFVRGDAARSTEGSGLGLNIAQSLAALQKGELSVAADGDLFKVTLTLPLA